MTARVITVGGRCGGLETAFSLVTLLKSTSTISRIDKKWPSLLYSIDP